LKITGGNARLAGNPLGGSIGSGSGISVIAGTPLISGNTIVNNRASDRNGGGVSVSSAFGYFVSNIISGNTAWRGGGISVISASAIMTDNYVFSNSATYGGGLIAEGGQFLNNTFISNSADYGGGLYLGLGHWNILTNNLVADNYANITGSGIYIFGSTQLLHTTIANNSGGDRSGVAVNDGSFLKMILLTNTILVGHNIGISIAALNNVIMESTLWHNNGTNWTGAGTITTANDYNR
jgi:hypothetical protein